MVLAGTACAVVGILLADCEGLKRLLGLTLMLAGAVCGLTGLAHLVASLWHMRHGALLPQF